MCSSIFIPAPGTKETMYKTKKRAANKRRNPRQRWPSQKLSSNRKILKHNHKTAAVPTNPTSKCWTPQEPSMGSSNTGAKLFGPLQDQLPKVGWGGRGFQSAWPTKDLRLLSSGFLQRWTNINAWYLSTRETFQFKNNPARAFESLLLGSASLQAPVSNPSPCKQRGYPAKYRRASCWRDPLQRVSSGWTQNTLQSQLIDAAPPSYNNKHRYWKGPPKRVLSSAQLMKTSVGWNPILGFLVDARVAAHPCVERCCHPHCLIRVLGIHFSLVSIQ